MRKWEERRYRGQLERLDWGEGGQVRSITLSSNTVMPLGASFPSRIVLLVFVFGSAFYSSLCTESSPLLSLPTVIVSSSSSSLICCFISGNQENQPFQN